MSRSDGIPLLSRKAPAAGLARLRALLAGAIELTDAAMGNIQIYDPETRTLQIIVQQGFKKDFLEYFQVVKASDRTACGRSAAGGVPVIIPDVTRELGYEPHLAIAASAGYRSCMSVPVLDAERRLCGIISVHGRKPRADWDSDALHGVLPQIAALLEAVIERA